MTEIQTLCGTVSEKDGGLKNEFEITDGELVKYLGTSETVVIPQGVTGIGKEAFYGCVGMKNVMIPNSVTEIGKFSFGDCVGLKNIFIPDSVTTIGAWAFEGCTELKKITIPKRFKKRVKKDIFSEVIFRVSKVEIVYIK